jgi:hypothetical protein
MTMTELHTFVQCPLTSASQLYTVRDDKGHYLGVYRGLSSDDAIAKQKAEQNTFSIQHLGCTASVEEPVEWRPRYY